MSKPKSPPVVAPVLEATANLGMIDGATFEIWLDDLNEEPTDALTESVRLWWDLASKGTPGKHER